MQNLIKKHAALLQELSSRDQRIDEVVLEGEQMIAEEHFAADDIRKRNSRS